MQEEHQLVMKKSQNSALQQKKQYDKHVLLLLGYRVLEYDKHVLLLLGYRVLVKNMTPCGGLGKLKSYWEEEITSGG